MRAGRIPVWALERISGGSKIDSQTRWESVSRVCCGSSGGPKQKGGDQAAREDVGVR